MCLNVGKFEAIRRLISSTRGPTSIYIHAIQAASFPNIQAASTSRLSSNHVIQFRKFGHYSASEMIYFPAPRMVESCKSAASKDGVLVSSISRRLIHGAEFG